MVTRLKLKRGEGKLVGAGSQVGSRRRRAQLPQFAPQDSPPVVPEASVSMCHEGGNDNMTEDEKDFFDMKEMVKDLYEERNTRLYGESSRHPRGEGSPRGGGNGNGDKPLSSSPPSSPSSSSSSTTTTLTHTHQHTSKGIGKTPLLKLDIKFELLMYNGEVNAENLENWVHQFEVCFRIKNLKDDYTKIQLASLRLEGETLVWWEAKTQEEMKNHGKISISLSNFISIIKI